MKAFLLLLSMGCFTQAFSQQEYFVFLQTENHQPFYVRMNEKNYSSSSSGYLILSKLKDSTYSFVIGFPQNQFPEQDFSVPVKKDRGLEVKNMGEKGWALFDLQTLELISPNKPAGKDNGAGSGGASYSMVKKNDDFAKMMASVVNDTAVLYNVVMEEKKAETKTDVVKTEEPKSIEPKPEDTKSHGTLIPEAATTTQVAIDSVKQEPVKTEGPKAHKAEESLPTKTAQELKDSVMNPPALPVIAVVKQFETDSGYHMIIVDDLKDSISIFIPADEKKKPEEKPVEKVTVMDTVSTNKTDSTLHKNSELPAKETVVDTPKTQQKLVMMNSDCRNFATAGDVDKLRVKLISEKDSEARISAAKKAFKGKCYSAQQIKALSEMFPYDEQKYHFFEAAYPFVSDTGNFKGLVSLLSDPVYVERFRKLVRLD